MKNDPTFEQNARQQWAKACRSIPLQGTSASGLPPLWLELKPTRAIAAQPRIDSSAMTLTMGIEAETRVTSAETKPNCTFPATLAIGPATVLTNATRFTEEKGHIQISAQDNRPRYYPNSRYDSGA
jgi:hypothetical protein